MASETEEITRGYENNLALYKALKDEIVYEIGNALDNSDIKYHSVHSRIKDLDSLITKATNGQLDNPLKQLKDIVGARVVTLFLSDIGKIIDVIKKTFDVNHVDNKIDDTDPRLFGYFSVHLHAKIKSSFSGTRYDKIKHLTFEIQIRTIAMDAWASASHYLDYKSEADVPEDLLRDFNALSGLFYVADKHFEMFFRSRAASLKKIDRTLKSNSFDLQGPLNLDTLTGYLKYRYPDREQSNGSDVSALLQEIRADGINDLSVLAEKLHSIEEAFLAREKRRPPVKIEPHTNKRTEIRFATIGVVRVSLRMLKGED